MEFLIKLKKRRRKAQHVRFLEIRINNLHNEIVHDVIEKDPKTALLKANLLKKYNRRLSLILY